MTRTTESDGCGVCGDPPTEHARIHPYVPPGHSLPPSTFSRDRRVPASKPTVPFDPVLRQALLDKGILTVQDLRDAEEKVLAVLAQAIPQMMGEPPSPSTFSQRGVGSDDSRPEPR